MKILSDEGKIHLNGVIKKINRIKMLNEERIILMIISFVIQIRSS